MKYWFWTLSALVLLGLALGTSSREDFLQSLIFLSLAILLLLLQRISLSKIDILIFALLFLVVGYWYGHQRLIFYEVLPETKEAQGLFRVTEVTEEASFYQKIILKEVRCQSEQDCLETKILWQAPLLEDPHPGALYSFTCSLNRPENFSEDFNYQRYLAKEGVGYMCKQEASFRREPFDRQGRIYQGLFAPRFWFENLLKKLYPQPESSLAAGLLLGGSKRLPENIQEQFKQLGLTHIVAVSGYNIVLIVNAFLLAGIWLGLYRKQAVGVALVGIVLFIIVIGAPASAVRAGLMAGAALGAFLISRPSYSLRALFATAVAMALWNPLVLLYDAGFQLSFLATIGVLFGLRFLQEHLATGTLTRFYQETAWLSFFVYIFLLPILVYQFGRVTPFSVLANMLFLPLVPVAMFFSFVGALVTSLVPAATLFIGWLGYIPLTFILRGTELLSNLPYASLPFYLPLALVLLLYTVVCSVLVVYERKRLRKKYQKSFTCPHQH
jgi:competence protein ComEC